MNKWKKLGMKFTFATLALSSIELFHFKPVQANQVAESEQIVAENIVSDDTYKDLDGRWRVNWKNDFGMHRGILNISGNRGYLTLKVVRNDGMAYTVRERFTLLEDEEEENKYILKGKWLKTYGSPMNNMYDRDMIIVKKAPDGSVSAKVCNLNKCENKRIMGMYNLALMK